MLAVGVTAALIKARKSQMHRRSLERSFLPVVTRLGRLDGVTQMSSETSAFGTVISRRQMKTLRECHDATNAAALSFHHAGRTRSGSIGANFVNGTVGSRAVNAYGLSTRITRLRDLSGSEYVGTVCVGTPSYSTERNYTAGGIRQCQAKLRVIYDTGSSDFWVASDLCRKGPCTDELRHRYNHSLSATFRLPAKPASLHTVYGSGELRGELGIDDVTVGPLFVQRQSMGLIAEEEGSVFDVLNFDGIVGLGFAAIGHESIVPLVDNMISQGALPNREFSLYLHSDPSIGGAIIWGGTDPRLYDGELMWFPVVSETYWTLELFSFSLGQQSARTKASLIVDTGTTFFFVPSRISQWVQYVTREATCTAMGKLPSLVYTVKDVNGVLRQLSIQPAEYMVRDHVFDKCIPAVVPSAFSSELEETMILGEVFMRHHFVVFSRGTPYDPRPRIGIARSKHGADVDAFFSEVEGLDSRE
eukprot:TRINITY_DN7623_c0_g1_i1.p1 TRINITY_DN7623_c0_g1~~TRINITY_DN7623_c0_g1_i1.p1  ORF type:complete len:499 (-),score=53.52 TRINITY_DN7623_c0_g1_i1:2-1423(-)